MEAVAAALEGVWDRSSAAAAAANADCLGASDKAAVNLVANYNGSGGPVSTLPLPQQAASRGTDSRPNVMVYGERRAGQWGAWMPVALYQT